MPDFPIVDTPVHLREPDHLRMPWLEGNAQLDCPYGLTAYREHTAGIAIEAFVYLQVDVDPAYALPEADWALARAAAEPRLRGGALVGPSSRGGHSGDSASRGEPDATAGVRHL